MNSKGIAWLLWALAWMLPGAHRFYLGKPLSGFFFFITYNFLGMGLLMDAFMLNDMVDAANARDQRLLRAHPHLALGDSMVTVLLKAAERRGGQLTLTEAVMETGRPFKDVEQELLTLLQDGHCSVENHAETGVVIYRFPELELRRPRLT